MRTVLIHEWIERSGGAERVLDAFSSIFADAEINCLWDSSGGRYPDRRVRQSFLQVLRRHKALALPFMPFAWSQVASRIKSADRVLISSHLFAHHVRGGRRSQTFVYVHTPARYIWAPEDDPRGRQPLARLFARPIRAYDRYAPARHTASYVANSEFVARRIRKDWNIEVPVIYPPVDVSRLQATDSWEADLDGADKLLLAGLPRQFILGASRLVTYKELDVVIKAGDDARLPVVIAGDGPAETELRQLADQVTIPVVFLPSPSDALLYALFQRCLAYVFPPVEDFGIMPVEAMAVGGRVIVNAEGGAAESVVDNVSGVHWNRRGGETFASALRRVRSIEPASAKQRASRFSSERFAEEILAWIR